MTEIKHDFWPGFFAQNPQLCIQREIHERDIKLIKAAAGSHEIVAETKGVIHYRRKNHVRQEQQVEA